MAMPGRDRAPLGNAVAWPGDGRARQGQWPGNGRITVVIK
jgi:hypothetical protein